MLQCQGVPGSSPSDAKATVRYFGGVEIVEASGDKLTVVSLISPYVMHVSDLAPSDQFEDANYVRVPLFSANLLFNPDALTRPG